MNRLGRAGLTTLALLSLAACSQSTRWEGPPPAPAKPASPVVDETGQPPRSQRGNPPFYEVYGQRYYVMSSSHGYRERGVASWYGKKFHGRPTSSGERYDMHAMTAAHKTLPLPTRVRVTNLSNNRSVIVMVNDRGPFVHNRIIDLSYAAASKLDMIGPGTALVEVETLPFGPSTQTAAAKPMPAEPVRQAASTSPALYMQVGAFGELANANQLKERLLAGGVANVEIHHVETEQPALYRVRLGPISNVAEYDELVRRVSDFNIRETHLVTQNGEIGSLQ